jgi:hypothetical protein
MQVRTRELYSRYEAWVAAKKLDVQFSVITLYTGIVFFSSSNTLGANVALGLNVALFVIELAWERIGEKAICEENEIYMYMFWALSLFLPAFVVNIAIDYFSKNALLASAEHASVIVTIGIFGILTVINRLLTVICSIILYRSFGEKYQGLRRLLAGDRLLRFGRGRRTKLAAETSGNGHGNVRLPTGYVAGAELQHTDGVTVANPLQSINNGTYDGEDDYFNEEEAEDVTRTTVELTILQSGLGTALPDRQNRVQVMGAQAPTR